MAKSNSKASQKKRSSKGTPHINKYESLARKDTKVTKSKRK